MIPASELSRPGLLRNIIRQSIGDTVHHLHKDTIHNPDIISLPSPPQPNHSGATNSGTNPCNDKTIGIW
jgi:hypothetical protein